VSAHMFIRPGQVAPDLPAPDRCMTCGEPQAGHVTYLPRRGLPDDPLDALKEVVAEYAAASNKERNHGSSRYAHLMWSYLTDLMPVVEQRSADRKAQAQARIAEIMGDHPQYRNGLRVVE
jgi:hypothetical protein